MMCLFFFKQKPAYEMRISDWSSDVCSSDLLRRRNEVGVALLFDADLAAQCGVVQVVFVDGDIGRAVIVMLDHAADVKRQHLPFALPPTAAGHRVPAVALQLGSGAEQTGVVGHVEHRSEEHTSELQSLMRISYAVFCLKKKNTHKL